MSDSGNRTSAKSRAYPTIGIILLGGLSDSERRVPRHTSAGFAYTGLNDDIFVETELFTADREEGFVNGEKIDTSGNRSPFKVLNEFRESIMSHNGISDGNVKLSFDSRNVGVLSGSSDGAAAAMGKCVEAMSGASMDWAGFENRLRMISESVGRSVYGGLSITPQAEQPVTERLLDPSDFSDYVIVGCRFSTRRKPSDRIHENVVNSPDYHKRIESTAKKGEKLRKLAAEKDIRGIFELAMEDTDEYHSLIESVGVQIITDEMRAFMERVRELRKDAWMTYIVTGGSNVFVPIRKENYEIIMKEAPGFNADPVALKVADRAYIMDE